MKITLIILGIVFVIKFFIKELSKPDDSKVRNNEINIEQGYPTFKMQSLHLDSTIESPLANHNFSDEQLSKFNEENDDNNSYKQIYSKNLFVESHYELNLSLFKRELTAQMVNNAYEKVLDEHLDKIRKGIPDDFNIKDKKEARDYLLRKVDK